MRVLVTGHARRRSDVVDALDRLEPTSLVVGCPTGAASIAREWAALADVPVHTYLADFAHNDDDEEARQKRNTLMINQGRPVTVVAFWDGIGRDDLDLIRKATRGGIPVAVVPHA